MQPFLELEGASPSPAKGPILKKNVEETTPAIKTPGKQKTPAKQKTPLVEFKTPIQTPAAGHSRTNSSGAFHTTLLRSNLMREQRDRDPLFYYEMQKVMGVGSMGSVVLVKKRESVVGGSARADLRDTFRREKTIKTCVKIPGCGLIINYCLWNPFSRGEEHHARAESSRNSSIRSLLGMAEKPTPFQPMNDSGRSVDTPESFRPEVNKAKTLLYAMKSIHLSRVTDESFVEELRNEIRILKSLDHPHIVKAIETFEHRNQIFIIMESCGGGDLYTRYDNERLAFYNSVVLFGFS